MLTLASIRLDALSVAGVETCIQLPEYRIAFDVGRAQDRVVSCERIFLTHGHMDHAAGLPYHAGMRSMRGMAPPTYVVPPGMAEPLAELFVAARRLDGGEFRHRVVPLAPGERFRLRPNCFVTAFATDHRIPSQGYIVWESRHKLRPEFQGRAGHELGALRAEGVTIEDTIEIPMVAFTGDTLVDVLHREPDVQRAKLLILETTFVGPEPDVAAARSRGHIHLDELPALADRLQNEAILLTHFSTRHSRETVLAEIERTLPESMRRRVTALV